MLSASVFWNAASSALRGLSQHQVGVPRRAVAQRRAGDDGHVQKARIAQKPAQRRLFYQRIMERRTVPAIPSIDENDKLPLFSRRRSVCG